MADNVSGGAVPDIGKSSGTTDLTGQSALLEGAEISVPDEVRTAPGVATRQSGRPKTMRLVRNVSGIALAPKRAVTWATGYRGRRVGGYCTTTAAEIAGVVDDRLPSAGVPANELFWIHRSGPALCKNDIASGAPTVITEGNIIVALTAVTSQATTSGRIANGNAATLAHVDAKIGRAMSSKTTANTNADVLIDLAIL